jgi:hypothetical protein
VNATFNSLNTPRRLRRRDFLAWGSLAALAPFTPWVNRAASAAAPDDGGGSAESAVQEGAPAGVAPSPAAPARALSAGYLEGSQELENLRKLAPDLRILTITRRGNTLQEGRSMVPADELPAGDPALVGGPVRMTIHDLYPGVLPSDPAVAASWPAAVDLDVLVPLIDGTANATALYHAWSYRRLPAEDRSARVSFLLWPDWYSDLSVVLRVLPAGAGAAAQTLVAKFALGAEANRPKLLKGVYLLGLREGAWNERVDLPDDPSQVAPEQLSVLMTIEPEGVRGGVSR